MPKGRATTIDQHIDEIEAALFDSDEPGCRDQDYFSELIINEVGRLRLRRIIRRIRSEASCESRALRRELAELRRPTPQQAMIERIVGRRPR